MIALFALLAYFTGFAFFAGVFFSDEVSRKYPNYYLAMGLSLAWPLAVISGVSVTLGGPGLADIYRKFERD